MKKSGMLFLFLAPFLLNAQKKDKQALKFSKTISAADLKNRLYTVASAEMEGRDTPSPGLEKAGDYIENQFKSMGLSAGNNGEYRMHFPLYRDSVTGSSLKINDNVFDINIDYQPISNINHTAAMAFSEIVFAGYGIVDESRDDYKNLEISGKIVLLLDGTPEGYKPAVGGFRSPAGVYGKIMNAGKKGAAAVLVVFDNFPRKIPAGRPQWSMSGYTPTMFPLSFAVSEKVAESLLGTDGKGIIAAMKESPKEPKLYKSNTDISFFKETTMGKAANILGVVEGTDKKDEWVIVTAHYDHLGTRNGEIYYGADDDGSGTVSLLEIAEAFAKAKAAGKGPRRSMLFMTVSGEEHGLWGSAYYAENPVYPLEKTSVDLNIDMVGRVGNEYLTRKDSSNYIYVIGDDKLSSDLTPITDNINKAYLKMNLDRKYNDPKDPNRFYYRSDHYNFAEKGVPIIFYFNGVHKDYHKPTDTPDKINYQLMEKRARLVFYTAWEMANRNEMMKRDIPLSK